MKNFFKGLLVAFLIALIFGGLYLYRMSSVNHRDEICDQIGCGKKRFVWVDIAVKEPKNSYQLRDEDIFKEAEGLKHILIERCEDHYPVKPSHQEEWNIKARILLTEKKINKALGVLKEAGKINPSWIFAGTALLREANFLEESLEYTQQLVHDNPEKAGLWIELARTQALMKQKKMMFESLKKALKLQAGYQNSIPNLPEFKEYLQDPEFTSLLKGK